MARGLARGAARAGHEVHVASCGVDEVGVNTDLGVRHHFLPGADVHLRPLTAAFRYAPLIHRIRPDVLICFTSGEALLLAGIARALGIVAVMHVGEPDLPRLSLGIKGLAVVRRTGLSLLAIPAARWGVRRVLSISDYTSAQLADRWGVRRDRIVTLGTGIDEAFFASGAQPPHREHGQPLRLVSVGRIALQQKPLDVVAAALARTKVSWASWTIIGTGADESLLRRAVDQYGLTQRVRWRGFLPPEKIVAELAEHDVVLLPSRHESFFMTPYEALLRRRFVVTNDVAEIRRWLGQCKMLEIASEVSPEAYDRSLTRVAKQVYNVSASYDDPVVRKLAKKLHWDTVTDRLLSELGALR